MDRRTFNLMLGQGLLCASARPLLAHGMQARAVPKFSCMVWALEKQASFDHCLEMVAGAGYQGVELVGEFQRWNADETRSWVKRLGSLGLVVDAASGVKTGFAVPAQSDAFRAEFRDHLRAMQTLGCRRAILLSGPAVEGVSAETQMQVAAENLKVAADLAAQQGVEIVIEPIDPLENPTIFLQSVGEGFPLARAVGRPNVKVLYDLYHEQRGFGNLIEKLQKNIDLVGLVHVADVPGRHEPGTGEIDYSTVYRTLAEGGYKGWIAMEFYPTQDPMTTLRSARESALSAFGG